MKLSEIESQMDKKSFLFEIKSFEVVIRKSPYRDGVNVLTNNLKISDVTNADIFQLNLSGIHWKIGKSWCRADFSSVSNPLTRWLPNGVLEQDLLDA